MTTTKIIAAINSSLIISIICSSSCRSITASQLDSLCIGANSRGNCSSDMLASNDGRPEDTQARLIDDYRSSLALTMANDSTSTAGGCYSIDMADSDGERIPVWFYFGWNDLEVDETRYACYDGASKVLKKGCSGSAGGVVSLDWCCLRYEIYDICGG